MWDNRKLYRQMPQQTTASPNGLKLQAFTDKQNPSYPQQTLGNPTPSAYTAPTKINQPSVLPNASHQVE
ncbi:hypothetical protein [Aquitalea magnusonii]|uniref:hypothetical protein n=1 Tax=Aquitalea magnusonii TaxID=332411 RepID=UPI0011B4D026|nr:hypothetical protein [Aquitalea magnusonii]